MLTMESSLPGVPHLGEGTWLGQDSHPADTFLPLQSGSYMRSGRNAGTSKVSMGQCPPLGLGWGGPSPARHQFWLQS